MIAGVDTSVLVAAVHANHPMHAVASTWLDSAFSEHEVLIAHHSVVESYAVLTRLPSKFRLSPQEAQMVLRETLHGNARLASFVAESVWSTLDSIVHRGAAGGPTYDAFIINILAEAGADVIVTFNAREFRGLAGDLRVAEPSDV